MDPVTAVQLASAVISFVQAGAVVLKTAREIRDSADGLPDDIRNRRVIVESMKGALAKLKDACGSTTAGKSTVDRSLLDLVAECEDLSKKIEGCVEKIQKSRLGTFGSAGKALFKKNELEGLETRLDRCRGQLVFELGNLREYAFPLLHRRTLFWLVLFGPIGRVVLLLILASSERLAEYFENLESLMRRDRSKLEQLFVDLKGLIEGVQRGHIGDEAQAQVDGLIGIQNQALCAIHQDRILQSLRFEGMGRRYENVQRCNQKTFTWIFENAGDELGTDEGYESKSDDRHELGTGGKTEPDASEDSLSLDIDHNEKRLEMKREARNRFLSWVSSPAGIFHISGKLGSGKSTLMKFLYNSRFTRTQAQKWAGKSKDPGHCFGPNKADFRSVGSRKLIYANFFFWKPGSEMQKSLDGLFRSLLHDIVRVSPDLTRDVLHRYWDEAQQTPLQAQPFCNIPSDVVQKALETIITDRRVNEGHCFCFFLDALDECDDGARYQYDRLFLVELLQRWVKASEGSLALCVSSRENNVFMNAFPETLRLQLHKLTLFDIRNYTRQALERFPDKKIRQHLIDVLPYKAKGIFLWAVLVIKNLRRMMPDSHINSHELNKLLDELPSELEDLLRHIIASLTKHERKAAYQVMKLVQTAHDHKLSLSLLAFSFLGEYQKNQNFAFRDDFPTLEMQGIRKDDAFTRYHKQLRRVCGGLVEFHPYVHVSDGWGDIEFTHRSVPEMFEETDLKEDMESTLGDFDPVLGLSHLICAQVQFVNDNRGRLYYHKVIDMLIITGAEDGSYTHLEFIESQFRALRPLDLGDCHEIAFQLSQANIFTGYTRTTRQSTTGLLHSVLCQAVHRKYTKYVRWRIMNDPHALDHPLEGAIAVQQMFEYGMKFWTWNDSVGARVFNNESKVNFVYCKFIYGDVSPDNLTAWERHLVWGFTAWVEGSLTFDKRFGEVAEMFLRHGAGTDLVVHMKGGSIGWEVILRFDNAKVYIRDLMGYGIPRVKEFHSMLRRTGSEWDVHLTLQDWIEATDLENKGRLLRLIDSGREEALGNCDTSRPTDVERSRVEDEDKPEPGEPQALGSKQVAAGIEAGQVPMGKVAIGM